MTNDSEAREKPPPTPLPFAEEETRALEERLRDKRKELARRLKAYGPTVLLGLTLVVGAVWFFVHHAAPPPFSQLIVHPAVTQAQPVVEKPSAYVAPSRPSGYTVFTSVPLPITMTGDDGQPQPTRTASCAQVVPVRLGNDAGVPRLIRTYVSHGRTQPVLVCEWEE